MKADRLLICDLDFSGCNQFDAQESIYFDKDADSTDGILQTAFNIMSSKKIANVFLIVHGISTSSSEGYNGMSMTAPYSRSEKVGGFGLVLGSRMIDVTNDFLFRKWAPAHLRNIVFLSCYAAYCDPKKVGGWGDGRLLMQNIANATGATVYCSDGMQYINQDWGGDMYRFDPHSSGRGNKVLRPYPSLLQRTYASFCENDVDFQ